MQHIQYCSHSRQAFIYQFCLLNGDKFPSFDTLYSNLINDIKRSGNGELIKSIPNQKLLKEANEIYEKTEGIL